MAAPSLRRNLYKKDPHCHWCGRETYLVMKKPGMTGKQRATVDHVKCRAEADSWVEYVSPSNKVLACYLCNQQRNNVFMANNPVPKQKWKVPV